MAKTNTITKVSTGQVCDPDEFNQNLENAGNEGGSIPYDGTTHQRETDGSEDLGSQSYPWGNLYVADGKILYLIETTGHTVSSQIPFASIISNSYTRTLMLMGA